MRDLLDHPWVRLLLIATTVAMCSFALRETASITLPILNALFDVAVPLAIGFVIAYILTPLVDLISRRVGFARWVAAAALFLAATALTVGLAIIIVPLLARQGVELMRQLVHGEPYLDQNGNGRRDEGEPFTDLNGNRVHDAAVLARLTAWAEERQRHLKRLAQEPLDERELAWLSVYLAETAPARARYEALLSGQPPPGEAPADAPPAWDPSWPPAPEATAAAVARHPELAPHLHAAAAAWATAHQRTLEALRALRGADISADPALMQRLREAGQRPPQLAERPALEAGLKMLEHEALAGAPGAREVLRELRGGDAAFAGEAVAHGLERIGTTVRGMIDRLPERLAAWAESAFGSIGAILGLLLDIILVPIYAFFLVLAMPVIRAEVKALIPMAHREDTLRILHEIERAVAAFFRGRLIICILCSLVGVAGFLVLQLFDFSVPYGILFGVLLGLVTPIPLAGIVVIVPALALTMLQPEAGGLHLALVLLVYGLVQATEAVLIPIVLGREVEVHPVWLIIALILCGKLLGVLGLILAVPIAATVRILGREYLWPRLKAWAARSVEAVQPPPREGA